MRVSSGYRSSSLHFLGRAPPRSCPSAAPDRPAVLALISKLCSRPKPKPQAPLEPSVHVNPGPRARNPYVYTILCLLFTLGSFGILGDDIGKHFGFCIRTLPEGLRDRLCGVVRLPAPGTGPTVLSSGEFGAFLSGVGPSSKLI